MFEGGEIINGKLLVVVDGFCLVLGVCCGISWQQQLYEQIVIIVNVSIVLFYEGCVFECFIEYGLLVMLLML